MMRSIAVGIDLGSLGTTFRLRVVRNERAGLSDLKCMVNEKASKTCITVRHAQRLLCSRHKGSSFRLLHSPHLGAKGQMKISLRATFLIAGINYLSSALDSLPRTGESG